MLRREKFFADVALVLFLQEFDGVLMLLFVPFLAVPSEDRSAPSEHENCILSLLKHGGGTTRAHGAGRLLLS